IVLAVVGTKSCGKSTLVYKGLSSYGLKESTVTKPLLADLFPDVRQACSVFLDFSTEPSLPVEVVEIEIQSTDRGPLKLPQELLPIDGVMICYDSSDRESFQPVKSLLHAYRTMSIPTMVLQCKSDLEREIEPRDALSMLEQYDTGLIEVTNTSSTGKEKMRQSFHYMLKAVLRQRGRDPNIENRNPATPDLTYQNPPWADSCNNTPSTSPVIPVPSSSASDIECNNIDINLQTTILSAELHPSIQHEINILPENGQSALVEDTQIAVTEIEDTQHSTDANENPLGLSDEQPILDEKKNGTPREPRPAQWSDLEALLDKLLFVAVSGEDPTFITHFLLTYRRFATPRSVLLAMQKRMRQLDSPCGDPMFACFAQMRICNLLEMWIRDFPHDFAVQGTAGALNALIKSIISKTHLLHYGSEFLPFLEELPSLVDRDSAWALKVEITDNDTDSGSEEETHVVETKESHSADRTPDPPNVATASRQRKSSLPHPKAMLPPQLNNPYQPLNDYTPKQHIKDLVKLAQDVLSTDSEEIAQEITRKGVKQFLDIEPRDWLQFTFVSGKKTNPDPIAEFNTTSNHLATGLVISLILCHERPRHRSRQIEKFVEIAQKLRQLNNYSALRAFVAGINIATDDPTMEQFKAKAPEAAKNLMSWDVLLQQIRSHRAYRLALRNSKGACIPALEVHMSDLIRAHEGNGETNTDYPDKIHWGKFNMMGRFITSTLQCQAQCRNSNDYDFPKREAIAELLSRKPVMSIEVRADSWTLTVMLTT
ncbi:ras guanine nucleotide exchange factor domain-containing protein, partial [Gymnopilus junonius]